MCYAKKSWVNDYGYDEGFIFKELTKYLSGHLCRGSAIETDSDCGNCDGARCDSCEMIFVVTEYDSPRWKTDRFGYEYRYCPIIRSKRFDSKEEAQKFYDSIV